MVQLLAQSASLFCAQHRFTLIDLSFDQGITCPASTTETLHVCYSFNFTVSNLDALQCLPPQRERDLSGGNYSVPPEAKTTKDIYTLPLPGVVHVFAAAALPLDMHISREAQFSVCHLSSFISGHYSLVTILMLIIEKWLTH